MGKKRNDQTKCVNMRDSKRKSSRKKRPKPSNRRSGPSISSTGTTVQTPDPHIPNVSPAFMLHAEKMLNESFLNSLRENANERVRKRLRMSPGNSCSLCVLADKVDKATLGLVYQLGPERLVLPNLELLDNLYLQHCLTKTINYQLLYHSGSARCKCLSYDTNDFNTWELLAQILYRMKISAQNICNTYEPSYITAVCEVYIDFNRQQFIRHLKEQLGWQHANIHEPHFHQTKCLDSIGDIGYPLHIQIRKRTRREHYIDKLDSHLADMAVISQRLDKLESE